MSDLNNYTLIGRLTRDVETKENNDITISEISIANNTWSKSGDKTNFFNITIFGKEGILKYLTKGTQVSVTGRLSHQTWEDKDGGKRSKVALTAQELQLLGSKPSNNDYDNDSLRDEDIPF